MNDKTQEINSHSMQKRDRHESADRCFCTEKAIDNVAQYLIDAGMFDDLHAAQTQAMFLVVGEGCECRKN